MIRSFIAFELPTEVRTSLAAIQNALKDSVPGVRWVKPAGIHLTLSFLGDIPEEQVPDIHGAVGKAAEGARPLSLRLSDVGAFPDPSRPRVVWVGLDGDVAELAEIKKKLDRELSPLGFVPEGRAFRPHLTLGRVKIQKNIQGLKELFARVGLARPVPFMVTKLILFKSDLFPDGARYTPLAEVEMTTGTENRKG